MKTRNFPRSETIIIPPRRWQAIDWRELWAYRGLFLALAWRDIAVRYKQTVIGLLWVAFQPLMTMAVFTVIFNRLAHIESGDATPYPIFVFTGLLFWQYFAATLTNSGNSIINNSFLVQKVYFPRMIIPATPAVAGFVDFSVSFVILCVMMAYYGVAPRPIGVLILPLLVGGVVLSALGGGFLLAALNVKYRDVRIVLPFFIQILLYVTPVIYPVKMLDGYPSIKSAMIWLNPMSGIIANARAGLLGQGEVDFCLLGISLFAGFVYFLCGLVCFRSVERYFADVL